MAVQVVGAEPGETTDEALELVDELYRLGRRQAPAARGRRRAPAALPEVPDPLVLVEEHRYDAAGVQSMRTYLKSVRRRHPRARSLSVSFGAPAPQSGGRKDVGSYKGEAIGYIRRLLERAAAEVNHGGDVEAYVNAKLNPTGRPLDDKLERRILAHTRRLERAGVLAIGHRAHRPGPPHNAELVRQMRKVEWSDRDRGTVKKGDDHVADALIALEAPQAVRHR